MFGVERDMDADMFRVWHMVQELSEQLAHNQKLVTTLQTQANTLKGQAIHNDTGYALRRFNVDLSQEVFESELERSNAQTIIENQTLLHENRQLSMLLKEYEQTMETVMSKFRNHAFAAQQHELTLSRHYETLLSSRETSSMKSELSNNALVSASIQRLSQSLRMLLRSLGGEETESSREDDRVMGELDDSLDDENREDWAVEREYEIARLEKENAELRKLLGIDTEGVRRLGWGEEELEDYRPVLHAMKATMAHANPQDSWGRRSPPQLQPFNVGPVPGNAVPTPPQNIPLQRTIEFQPGMRAAGTMRRPSMSSMFGRGRGSAPFWGPSPLQERQWLQGNGGLDLVG